MTRVAITAWGALSPFGVTADALWDGLVSGRSAVKPIAKHVAGGLPVTTGGEVRIETSDRERDLVMSRRSIDDALAMAGLVRAETALFWANGLDTFAHENRRDDRAALVEGVAGDQHGALVEGEARDQRSALVEGEARDQRGELVERSAGACFTAIAREHLRPRRMIATACASATQAIGEAFRAIRAGRVRAAVAGGATVMLTPHYALGFAWLQALAMDVAGEEPGAACKPFDRMRRGFALSEGGAALVLEDMDSARARGARVLGEVRGFGSSQDAYDLNRPPPDGAGAELCMRRALDDAGFGADRVAAINAHGTGTRAGDPAEVAAIRRLLGESWRSTPVTSVKGAIGHPMAAAGALQAIAATESCRRGIVPPTCNLVEPDEDCQLDHVMGTAREVDVPVVLSCSYGMGGQNACVVITRGDL
ncbi:MAG TPA: beta-ketoacyl-[acyl-carrier-protein] synthase family protein [Kofleriaceae bacterium]|nr:beta-ketoacyl-[acyl-carrier-protein] synthase family protein [Kofleriaceae bacterium]